MRKTAIAIVIIIIALFSFNERELYKKDIRNRLVIQGVGIDVEKDGSYTVTLQAINTGAQSASMSEGSPQNPVKTYRVKGETVYSAIKSVTEYEGKIPLYSQNRVIIIGRETAQKGIEGVIDFFVRDVENSASVRIAMAEKKASEIMETTSQNGDVITRNIEQSIRSAEYEPEISELQLYELADKYKEDAGGFVMPVVSVKEEGEQKEKRVEIKDSAVFVGGKLTGTVSRDETLMLNFLTNSSYNGAVSYKTAKGEKIAVSIIDSKTKRCVEIRDGKPVFDIRVRVECDVAEIYNGTEKTVGKARIEELESDAEKYLKGEIEKVTEKMYRKHQCDAAGLSRILYIKEPSFYRRHTKNLNTVMAESRYNVEVDVTVRRVGQEFVEIK